MYVQGKEVGTAFNTIHGFSHPLGFLACVDKKRPLYISINLVNNFKNILLKIFLSTLLLKSGLLSYKYKVQVGGRQMSEE